MKKIHPIQKLSTDRSLLSVEVNQMIGKNFLWHNQTILSQFYQQKKNRKKSIYQYVLPKEYYF